MVQTEIDRRLASLEKHEEESGAWHDRIITLEHQTETIVDWIEEQKDMQKRRENASGVWVRWIVTSLIGAAAAFAAVLAAEIARHG